MKKLYIYFLNCVTVNDKLSCGENDILYRNKNMMLVSEHCSLQSELLTVPQNISYVAMNVALMMFLDTTGILHHMPKETPQMLPFPHSFVPQYCSVNCKCVFSCLVSSYFTHFHQLGLCDL